jgi:hypothetical protein
MSNVTDRPRPSAPPVKLKSSKPAQPAKSKPIRLSRRDPRRRGG